MRPRRVVVLVGVFACAVACGVPSPATQPAAVGPLPAPVASSAPAKPSRVAWQASLGSGPVIAGGVIVAGSADGVREFDARTGAVRWTRTDPRQPLALELLVADDTVFAVVGHDVGHAPALVAPVAAELDALDLTSGRFLWSHRVAGGAQSPGLAAAGPVIALVDNGSPGAVVGLDPRTGARRWTEAAPGSCATPGQSLRASTFLAGSGDELAVGRRCGPVGERDVVVQGLDPGTGTARWTVPAVGGDADIFLGPPGSDVLVAAVRVGAGSVAERWSVPGPPVLAEQITAFDSTTGRPLWHESGLSNVATAGGDATTLCLTDDRGYECRNIATGALVVSSPAPRLASPTIDSGPVTQADGRIYQLDTTRLVVRSARTGAVTATTSLPIGRTAAEGRTASAGLVAAGDGLVLVRRADVDGLPVLAMTN